MNPPKTLEGLKRLAKKIKKSSGVQHSEALNLAAKQCGYNNYRHAFVVLSKEKPE